MPSKLGGTHKGSALDPPETLFENILAMLGVNLPLANVTKGSWTSQKL